MDKQLLSIKGMKVVSSHLSVLTIFEGILIISQAYYLADILSSLFRGERFANQIGEITLFLIFFSLRQFFVSLKKHIAFHYSLKTGEALRQSLIKALFRLGPSYIKKEGTGKTVTLIMEGMMKFRHYLEIFPPKFINISFIPIMIGLFIFIINLQSGMILFLSVPIVIIFMILLGWAAKKKADDQYQSYHLLSNHFVDSLRGLETLKYLGLSKDHTNKIKLVSERYRKATIDTLKMAFLSTFALDFFTMLSIATVAVFLGLDLIHGTIELKAALTILILAPEFFLPIKELGIDYHATLDGREAGKEIKEILAKNGMETGTVSISKWDLTSSLFIKNLFFSYHGDSSTAIQEVQFSISGFKKVGVIGPSGAGKSTFINVLGGFLPLTSGEIKLNNQQIPNFSQKKWQEQIAYIPQHPSIFHETILNNIRFYMPNATVEEVMNAANQAGLAEMIKELPEGLNTIIGEGGRALSGGQEQRIAIARAFLCNRPILLLDEPTAHLDIETEYELKETILPLFENKLVIFATHRLHWMMNMDTIVVLNHGKIMEAGTHEQLFNKKGVYFELLHDGVGI